MHLDSHKGRSKFTAKLANDNGAKLEQFDLPNEAAQADVLKELEGKEAVVTAIEKKKAQPQPRRAVHNIHHAAGCCTQTRFHYRPHHAYRQQLYEGIDVGQGAIGLITYMRTDSVNLADEALTEIRHYIENKIGKEYLPSAAKQYKTKSKMPKKRTKPSVRLPCTARPKASNPS